MGGHVGSSSQIIAQYKDDEWFNLGNLAQRKHSFNAITFTHFSDSITMIVGGYAESGWVFQINIHSPGTAIDKRYQKYKYIWFY